jgi:hypothetical protein
LFGLSDSFIVDTQVQSFLFILLGFITTEKLQNSVLCSSFLGQVFFVLLVRFVPIQKATVHILSLNSFLILTAFSAVSPSLGIADFVIGSTQFLISQSIYSGIALKGSFESILFQI